jgi:hypothetical protein
MPVAGLILLYCFGQSVFPQLPRIQLPLRHSVQGSATIQIRDGGFYASMGLQGFTQYPNLLHRIPAFFIFDCLSRTVVDFSTRRQFLQLDFILDPIQAVQLHAVGYVTASRLNILIPPAILTVTHRVRDVKTITQQDAGARMDEQFVIAFIQRNKFARPTAVLDQHLPAPLRLVPPGLDCDRVVQMLQDVLLDRIARIDRGANLAVHLVPRTVGLLSLIALQRHQVFIQPFPAVVAALHSEKGRRMFVIAIVPAIAGVSVTVDSSRPFDDNLEPALKSGIFGQIIWRFKWWSIAFLSCLRERARVQRLRVGHSRTCMRMLDRALAHILQAQGALGHSRARKREITASFKQLFKAALGAPDILLPF